LTEGPQDGEGDSLWTRLRRRKVGQWGIAYVAGAWGFLQGLAYISTLLDWPAHLQKLTGLALLIGLPIVLVLAWYHGEKGQQRVARVELAILTLLFLLGGGLFWRYQHTTESATPTAATAMTAVPVAADAGPSIAVLPFDNRSKLEDDAFFVDGIHDDILTQLSRVSALKVISRTSVEQFRETKLPIKSIAEQLGVRSILEGGVQRAGDRVRVNVQLIDANTDAHLWAETYDRDLTAANIFAIQSELASAIAGALKAALTPAEMARVNAVPTRNLDAWEAYQLGKQRMAKRTSAGLAEAEQFFRKAVSLDPSFALAHVGLADTLRLETEYSGASLDSKLPQAESSIQKALSIDPDLAEAWASRGGIAMSPADNTTAEQMLRRAIELNPNYSTAHHWLSIVLRRSGRVPEGLAHAERAAQLDPLSSIINSNLGDILNRQGRFAEAAARYQRAIDIDPASPLPYFVLGFTNAYARNRFADAVRLVERTIALDPGNPQWVWRLAMLQLDLTDASAAKRLMSEAMRRWPDDEYADSFAAILADMLGDHAAAEQYAREAFAALPRGGWSITVLRNSDLRKGDAKAARERYASAYPDLLSSPVPRVDSGNFYRAIDLALVLQGTGELVRAKALLDGGELAIRPLARLGIGGYWLADVQVHALRGDRAKALIALRDAEMAGWRGPFWRYYRDIDPNLESIRDEPEFKAVFADIERDVERQRAELAARPKDAPLDPSPAH
jgi:TolB-like protein/Tfp pilus assembly protein PilF